MLKIVNTTSHMCSTNPHCSGYHCGMIIFFVFLERTGINIELYTQFKNKGKFQEWTCTDKKKNQLAARRFWPPNSSTDLKSWELKNIIKRFYTFKITWEKIKKNKK